MREKKKPVAIDFTIGKLQPQAKDLEGAVLGAIMLEKTAYDLVAELLKPEVFYIQANQVIYRAILSLQQKNMPIDELTVVEELTKMEELINIGGAYYVTQLTTNVVSSANIETHAKIIIQKFIQREVIRIGGEMIGQAYEDSVDALELIDKVEASIFNVSTNNVKSNYQKVGQGLIEIVNRIDSLRKREITLTGIPTGFRELDLLTCGWQEPDLIILAARPSVGKTALALNLARNAAAIGNTPVGFFSLEMSIRQCRERLLAAESKIDLSKITRGQMDDKDMEKLMKYGVEPVDQLPIYIDDTSALSIYQLRSKVRSMVNKHKVKIVFIDYLQLMSGINSRDDNREREIAKISGSLKALAKELNIPIVCLSQLSREVEKRKSSDQMPKLSDLRDSGAIEQDADLVIFMYRPEYYGIKMNDKGESTKGETHLGIAKHRNGALDVIKLTAKLEIQKFVEYEYISPITAGFDSKPINGFIPNGYIPVSTDETYKF